MKKIGITGSISSGKTTASKILSAGRGPLFSADEVVKNLYKKDSFKNLIRKKFSIKEKLSFKFVFKNKPFIIFVAIAFGLTIIFFSKRYKKNLFMYLFFSFNIKC